MRTRKKSFDYVSHLAINSNEKEKTTSFLLSPLRLRPLVAGEAVHHGGGFNKRFSIVYLVCECSTPHNNTRLEF